MEGCFSPAGVRRSPAEIQAFADAAELLLLDRELDALTRRDGV